MVDEERKYLKYFGRVIKRGEISGVYDIGLIEVKTIGFIGEDPFTDEEPTSLAIHKYILEEDGRHINGTRLAYFKKRGEDWEFIISCEKYKELTNKEKMYFKQARNEAYSILKDPENFVTLEEYRKIP
jgi:hypothetical protein